ncbi:MAG: immune inhibitor A [Candidatus Cloacimonetes bacterium]|nr:immune inhibitor A [Candidatus Cloacimonadota bacterium]
MKKERVIVLLILAFSLSVLWSAPPAPGSWWQDDMSFAGVSEKYSNYQSERDFDLPDNILVLRCQFIDVSFDLDPNYPPGEPDPLPHDAAYFERFMFHLGAYWSDASAGNYQINPENYTLYPEVFTLSREMSYYGNDELSQERVSEMIVELLDMGDAEIDYSLYDSFIIFHAGAGQEADISGANTADIWTTFVSRSTLQAGLDPENDDFPGLEYDGVLLKEFVIVPETERQPDIQENDPIFGVLGVLCHEFGRQIGLPTLYDNQSSNGKSAGIGNYGVMGTGLWNAAGYVPPLPVAWCRIYLGWSDFVTIDSFTEAAELTYPMNTDSEMPKIYKVLISEDEYFLLENRQQNPDGSVIVDTVGNSAATFSFEIVEGQIYYEDGTPYFDFMTNTYAGCEWDFFLPGYGEGDALDMDGSGICIWHVDEFVMREKFNLAEEINVPNGVEEHKGIDLEEADHNQGLDVYGYYGYKDDTYRQGNNDYFGYVEYNGLPWNPTAESYYGGIQLEIYDISASAEVMSFSVDFEWSLDTGYTGENTLPAAWLDFGDGEQKLFYPMPNGDVFLWENDTLIAEENIPRDCLPVCWAWLESRKKILIPAEFANVASLHMLDENLYTTGQLLFVDYSWAAPPMVITDETGEEMIVLALNSTVDDDNNRIGLYDSDLTEIGEYFNIATYQVCGNMMYDGDVHIPVRDGNQFMIYKIDLANHYLNMEASLQTELELKNGILTEFRENAGKKMIFTTNDSLLVQFNQTGDTYSFEKEIPLPFICNSYPSYGDLDNNGVRELLYGGENSFVAIDEAGNTIKSSEELAIPDSSGICAGVVPIDLDGDNKLEVVGMMSHNRLCIWESQHDNDYRLKRYYPVTYGQGSRQYPVIKTGTAETVIYLPADNGRIFRNTGHNFLTSEIPVVYVGLARTAYIPWQAGNNEYEISSLFIDKETYIYPNPYSTIYNSTFVGGKEEFGKVGVHIMLSESTDAEIWVYDIAGNLVESSEISLSAYKAEVYLIDVGRLASGVYIARVKSGSEQKILKFGVEK